jgi:hypothetical protein
MKTTLDLSDSIYEEMKKFAMEHRTTMREIVESALRQYLRSRKKQEPLYRFDNPSFKGEGVCEGVREGDWDTIRSAIYEGRGG